MGVTELVASLGDNPYFGAGFGLFGIGAITAVSRKASQVSHVQNLVKFDRKCAYKH